MTDLEPIKPAITAEVLERYLAGASMPVECASVEAWLRADARRAQLVRVLRARLDAGNPGSKTDVASEWQRFVSRHLQGQTGGTPATVGAGLDAGASGTGINVRAGASTSRTWTGVPGRRMLLRWGSVAAGCLAVAGAMMLARGAARPGSGTIARAYATSTGQQATVTFDDGTRVVLAPRSVLRVTSFGATARTVELEGEGYFDVTRVGMAPFVVRAGGVTTRVLGTTFSVSHYAGDEHVRVVVMTGKVSVGRSAVAARMVTVTAGRVAEVTDSSTIVTPAGDPALYTGWQNGRLVFDKAPATEVLAVLGRWYGYTFRLADTSLARRRLKAGLSTRSSREAFSALELLLDVDLTVDGNVVTLTPRHPHPDAAPARRGAARDLLTPHTHSEVGR